MTPYVKGYWMFCTNCKEWLMGVFWSIFQKTKGIYNAFFVTNGREFQKIGRIVNNAVIVEGSVFPNEQYKFNGRHFRLGVNYVCFFFWCHWTVSRQKRSFFFLYFYQFTFYSSGARFCRKRQMEIALFTPECVWKFSTPSQITSISGCTSCLLQNIILKHCVFCCYASISIHNKSIMISFLFRCVLFFSILFSFSAKIKIRNLKNIFTFSI